MVKTNEEWTWNAIKYLVKHLDLQVNDVKQMWAEIDADEGVAEADRILKETCQDQDKDDFKNAMPEWSREMRFGND